MAQTTDAAVAAWIQPEGILLDVQVRDKEQLLGVVADEIARAHGLEAGSVFRALDRREQAGSTGVGDGFAVPHARIPGLTRPLTLFVRTTSGVEYSAPDGRPVSDFLAIMVPADGDNAGHLALLRLTAELFSDSGFRRRLDGSPTVPATAALFRSEISRLRPARAWGAGT